MAKDSHAMLLFLLWNDGGERMSEQEISAKYPGNCKDCGCRIKEGERIMYDKDAPAKQKVSCLKCGDNPNGDESSNTPGKEDSFQQSGSNSKGSLAGLKGKTDEEIIEFILKNQKSVKDYFESHNMTDNGYDTGQMTNLLILIKAVI